MKKVFIIPVIDIEQFDDYDIIITSGIATDSNADSAKEWIDAANIAEITMDTLGFIY